MLDAPLAREGSRNGQHLLGLVDADDPDARLGDRNGDPPRTGRELHHRPSGGERLVHVEADVLDHRSAPRVVDRCDRVVERHAGSVPVPAAARGK